MSDALSETAAAFVAGLEELCETQGVQMRISSDGVLELWPMSCDDHPLHIAGGVVDKLGPDA